jgi:putative Holliday junction resolvase
VSLSGADTSQTAETRAFAQALGNLLEVPVEFYDERLTTRLAGRLGGAASEDSRAAALLLENWLQAVTHG